MTDSLRRGILQIAERLPGSLGAAIRYLPDGPYLEYRAEEVFPSASVIKLPVLVELYAQCAEGRLSLAQRTALRVEDCIEGSGVLRYLRPGLTPTLGDLAELMIIVSDNTATTMLIRQLGVEAVNTRMRDLGLTSTTLGGRLALGQKALPQGDKGGTVGRSETSPRDMCLLMELLWRGTVVSEEACRRMLATLEHQQFMDLARYLPLDDLSEEAGRKASPVLIASKSGQVDGVRNDVGLITARTPHGESQYIVCVFTRDVQDGRIWTAENVAARAVGEVSRLAYDYLLHSLV